MRDRARRRAKGYPARPKRQHPPSVDGLAPDHYHELTMEERAELHTLGSFAFCSVREFRRHRWLKDIAEMGREAAGPWLEEAARPAIVPAGAGKEGV